MILLGHPHVQHEKLYHISSIEAIEHTPSNSTLVFSYNSEVFDLIEHARDNSLEFALEVSSLKDAIIGENLDAKYILLKRDIAKSVQRAADTYLFDAKILVHIEDEDSIESFANEGIDGVVFAEAIIKIV